LPLQHCGILLSKHSLLIPVSQYKGSADYCSLCHPCSSSRGSQPSTLIPDFCSRTVWHMRPTRFFTSDVKACQEPTHPGPFCDCALFDSFPLLQQSNRRTSDARSRGACDDKPRTCMALDCGCKTFTTEVYDDTAQFGALSFDTVVDHAGLSTPPDLLVGRLVTMGAG
jgi:hypothetical protein